MKITEIQIIPIKPNNGLIAIANIVVDNCFYLSSIGVHKKLNGFEYRITYPTKNNINIFHPIDKKISKYFEEEIIKKTKEILSI